MLKAYEDEDGKPRLKGVASSTIKDRHGDEMERTAIDDMVRGANQNLTIFLNHSYNVPEDVAGSVRQAEARLAGHNSEGSEIWDLDYDIAVNDANPRAVDAFKAIKAGTKLGLSIGAMIPEGGAARNKKTGAYRFSHVELLETSIVGIPANPRSWIQSAVKALKSLTETDTTPVGLIVDGKHYNATTNDSNILVLTESGGTTNEDAHGDDVFTGEDLGEPAAPEVHTTDPTPPEGEGDSSQGAEESEPENEPAPEKSVTASAADLTTFGEVLSALESTTKQLLEARRQSSEAEIARDAAVRARDEVISLTNEVLLETSHIVERLAALPVGRKAVLRQAQDDLSGLERMYSPTLLKLLRGTNGTD